MADTLSKVRLLDVCDFISGNAHEQHISALGQYTVINSKFVSTEGKVAKFAIENFCPAKKDDITLVMSDLPNGKALGKCFLVPEDKKYAVNQRVCILRSKGFDPKYLFYILNRNPYFLSFNDGVSQTHLLNSVFEKCYISVTEDIAEQKAIAKALSDIDELIESIYVEIAKTQNVKEAVCRPLVLGNTRLNGFTKKWVQRSLGDELGYEQPTKYLVNTTEHQETGNVPVLTAGKSFILGYSDDTEGVYTNTPTILFDDFTTDSKFVDFNFKVKSSACKMIKTINPRGNLRFFHTLMQYLEFRPYDHKRYWISEYSKLEILVPELTEQNAIAAIVEDFENQMKLLKSELAKYECIKQGMAHDLLTGKVRLV